MAITEAPTSEKPTGTIQSKLTYTTLPEDNSRLFIYAYPNPNGPQTNYDEETLPTSFTDLRSVPNYESEFTTDTTGFQLVKDSHTPPQDLLQAIARQEHERIEKEYYPKVEEILLKNIPGAKKVVIFDHTVRITQGNIQLDGKSMNDTPENRKPARRAHVDQTPWAGYERVRRHIEDPVLREKLLKGRVRIVNVWRPLRGPVRDVSLALADYRSIDLAKDLHESDLIFKERHGEIYVLTPNENQKWYYVKDQHPEDVTLIKCFDTAEGVAKLTPHGAFDLPDVPEGTLPRQSIEVRTLVFDNDGSEE